MLHVSRRCFFFFQAEDGIRDDLVTGVQTCALPICRVLGGWGVSGITTAQTGLPFDITESTDRCLCAGGNQRPDYLGGDVQFYDPRRSEERRVGKECRSRWSPYH